MRKITLNTSENKSITKIVDKYRALETELTDIQEQLEKLDLKKIALLGTLDEIRNEELVFFKKMKKTYGEGKLDILTMEYLVEK